jgi:hypothetical protein
MGEAAQELVPAVMEHDGFGDDRAELRHALAQPCRHAPAMQRQIGPSGALRHRRSLRQRPSD